MLDHLLSPRQWIETMQPSISARRARPAEPFVVVVGIAVHELAFILLGGLPGGVIEVELAEGAIVKPVIAHPSVHHGTLRRRDLQGWMRTEQRHDDREALVRRADHADAP